MRRIQRTIKKPVSIEGVGLFFGKPAQLTLRPAAPDSGIQFVRTDLDAKAAIPVNLDTLHARMRRMAVSYEDAEVETVEHLLSALRGLEVDNLEIEISGSEVPALDGSALPFVRLLEQAELADQDAPRRTFNLTQPVAVHEKDSSIVALPLDEGLEISFMLDYKAPIGTQRLTVELSDGSYRKEIAPARTFCLESEGKELQSQGLGSGATPENTVVVPPQGIRAETLRFADEFVRHKILDLLGDLCALPGALAARIIAVKSGHSLNLKFAQKLAEALDLAPRRPSETFLDVRELFKILPHRYPFLLVDKVIEVESYRRAVGIKNVTINEPYFQGHFPGRPIMPGVLQIEAMAQLAGALLLRKADNTTKLAVLMGLENVKFRKQVVPGDQLRIEAEVLSLKHRTGMVFTRATVGGELACEANMKFILVPAE